MSGKVADGLPGTQLTPGSSRPSAVVNSLKAPAQKPPTPLAPHPEPGNKKFNFKDFRELLKPGWRIDTALPATRPAQNEKDGTHGSLLGTPLAEGEQAPRAGSSLRTPGAGAIPPCDEHEALQAVLDPLTMVLAPPASSAAPVASDPTPRTDFAAAVEEIVRRISWGGDRRSGTARIELGRGALEGGAILVQALGRQVKVELDLPPGFDGRALEDRLRRRLTARGMDVVSVSLR